MTKKKVNGLAYLRPVTTFPLWTEEFIAGLDGNLVPLATLTLIPPTLCGLSTDRPSTASAPSTAFRALCKQRQYLINPFNYDRTSLCQQ